MSQDITFMGISLRVKDVIKSNDRPLGDGNMNFISKTKHIVYK